MIPAAWLDELRARSPLSPLVARRVKLIRAGREWKACCPFHSEKTPSFTINDAKGMYHCFGCGAHGDVIRWLTDGEGLNFIDAVRQLADAAGMTMPERSPEARARAERIDGIRPAIDAAARYYAARLEENGAAREYLMRRGIGPDMIDRFALGWAPHDARHVRQIPGMTAQAALAAGLIWRDDASGRDGATFRGRVMIPVHDARGRMIGFAGRSIDGTEPKYKNSPASEIFDKGRTLFNLHRAVERRHAARGGELPADGRLLIVEGQIDAMIADMAGLAAVAPMGTALTEQHLAAAWRIDAAPVLLFDGDAAGRRAARRACEMALAQLAHDRGLRIAMLPDGTDPDTLIRAHGVGAIHDVVFQAQPFDRWLFGELAAAADADDPASVAAMAHDLSEMAGKIADTLLRVEVEAAWAARFRSEISFAGRRAVAPVDGAGDTPPDAEPAGQTEKPGGSTQILAGMGTGMDDGAARQLRDGVRCILRLREERRGITEEIAAARAMMKALGFDIKALGRLIADLEAMPDGREEMESIWASYRRVFGIDGPLTEAALPAISADVRAKAGAAAGKRLRRAFAELDAAAIPAPVGLIGERAAHG